MFLPEAGSWKLAACFAGSWQLAAGSYFRTVPIPDGPPLTLMGAPADSLRPSKPNVLISRSTAHCASTVRLSALHAAPWHQWPICVSATSISAVLFSA